MYSKNLMRSALFSILLLALMVAAVAVAKTAAALEASTIFERNWQEASSGVFLGMGYFFLCRSSLNTNCFLDHAVLLILQILFKHHPKTETSTQSNTNPK